AERSAHLLLLLGRSKHGARPGVSEKPVEEAALLAGKRRGAVLRSAALIGECDQQRAALRGALCRSAMQLFKLILTALEIGPRLIDLAGKRPALGGRID